MQLFTTAIAASAARNQKIFYFTKFDPNYAIVRTYGSTMVLMKFDFKKQTFTNELKLMKLQEGDKGVELVRLVVNAKRPRVFSDRFGLFE